MPSSTAPTFDFGADDQTNALLLQDAQTFIVSTTARIMAAKHAHDLCSNNKNGTWGKWCATVGISRDTGDRLVNIAAQCGNIQIEGKSILDVQPLKLLYAAAKPSTPEVVKQAVFTGDITTYKEYQELMAQLKAEKNRADTAEKSAQNARKENAYFKELVKSAEAQTHKDAEKREEAESRYESALADISGLKEQNAQLKERADLPLPELSVEDGSLTYKGKHWRDMSGSDQLRVAAAIVRRLNPDCGFVLLDKLEQMDMTTLQEFSVWLETEHLQAIATRVSTGSECQIIIEDGMVKDTETSLPPVTEKPQQKSWTKGAF